MLDKIEQRWLPVLMMPIAELLNRFGISPNMVTLFRFLPTLCIGYLLSLGYLLVGGFLVLLVGSFDALDGTLARLSGKTTRFGSFLDSTLDRFADAVIYGGLLIHLLAQGNASLEIILLYATVVGVIMVAYTKHRAWSIGVEIHKGWLTRTEHIILLAFGLMLNQVILILWVLAVVSNLTAFQRMWLVWQTIDED